MIPHGDPTIGESTGGSNLMLKCLKCPWHFFFGKALLVAKIHSKGKIHLPFFGGVNTTHSALRFFGGPLLLGSWWKQLPFAQTN